MLKSLTEKHHTINRIIIFNDSISKFYQCSIWGFSWGISLFFSICLGKKYAEVTKFLGIFKKYVSKNNIFVQERKAMFHLIKKLFLSFTQFSNDFITQIIYCITHRCLCSHFISLFSLISISKKWNIETMLTFPYSYNWQKLTTTTKWMKKESRSIRVWTPNM